MQDSSEKFISFCNLITCLIPEQIRCPRSIMVKSLDCGILVSEFEFHSRFLRSLSDKYLWERHELPYSSSHGLNSTTTVILEGLALILNNLWS